MNSSIIKSHAKINLALNVTGKKKKLHKIESLISFIDLHDLIYLKSVNKNNHNVIFKGKFSKNISKINTVTSLLKLLDNRNLLNNQKFNISFVTKKKIGNATKRHKIKRRLRSIMNDAVKKISINFNYSYLVIAKATILNDEYTIIKDTLFQDFKRIK